MKLARVAFGALLGLVMVSSLAAATATTWYLDNATHKTETNYKVMCQDVPCGGTADVIIPSGQCQSWASDQPAAVNVNFAKNGWAGNLDTALGTVELKPYKYPSDLGYENGNTFPPNIQINGNTTFVASAFFGVDVGTMIASDPSQDGNFTVPAGSFLVFRVCNVGDLGLNMDLLTNGVSWILSPEASDPFPLPELAVGALSLAGLGAVGFVVLRNRKE